MSEKKETCSNCRYLFLAIDKCGRDDSFTCKAMNYALLLFNGKIPKSIPSWCPGKVEKDEREQSNDPIEYAVRMCDPCGDMEYLVLKPDLRTAKEIGETYVRTHGTGDDYKYIVTEERRSNWILITQIP